MVNPQKVRAMTVKTLYSKLEERIPRELSMEWDNDGLMCAPDPESEVRRVLVSLDVTDEIVDYAINEGFDVILSHHPLIFKPLSALNYNNHVSKKVIKLIIAGVSVFSFHTRLDRLSGGVNDILADIIGLTDVQPFGDGLGRIGVLPEESDLDDFANSIKLQLQADAIRVSDAYNSVRRVAVVGGSGGDYIKDAIACGADTFVSGSIGYHDMEDSSELGINLIEAGHYFTEFPVTEYLQELISEISEDIYIEIADSNMTRLV